MCFSDLPCGQRPGKPGDGVFVERAFGGHGLRARRCKRFQRAAERQQGQRESRQDHFTTMHRYSMRQICSRARSEEQTSELQSLMHISYAVFCLKTKKLRSLIPTY